MYIVVTEVGDDLSTIATLIHTGEKFLVWTFAGHPDDIERLGVTIKGMILIQV